jgi:hypothetical protein
VSHLHSLQSYTPIFRSWRPHIHFLLSPHSRRNFAKHFLKFSCRELPATVAYRNSTWTLRLTGVDIGLGQTAQKTVSSHIVTNGVYIVVARHWLVPSPWLASALFTATRLLPSNRHNILSYVPARVYFHGTSSRIFFFVWFVRLLALRSLLAYCASLGW